MPTTKLPETVATGIYPKSNDPVKNSYIEGRVEDQIKWFSKKSEINQKKFKRLSTISVILTALVPAITLLAGVNDLVTRIFLVAISSSVLILSTIMAINNPKELWIKYRISAEMLKSILHKYHTSSNEFDINDEEKKFRLLVEKCEDCISRDVEYWKGMQKVDNQVNS
jgi:hypothetical protein